MIFLEKARIRFNLSSGEESPSVRKIFISNLDLDIVML